MHGAPHQPQGPRSTTRRTVGGSRGADVGLRAGEHLTDTLFFKAGPEHVPAPCLGSAGSPAPQGAAPPAGAAWLVGRPLAWGSRGPAAQLALRIAP